MIYLLLILELVEIDSYREDIKTLQQELSDVESKLSCEKDKGRGKVCLHYWEHKYSGIIILNNGTLRTQSKAIRARRSNSKVEEREDIQ